MKDLRLVFEPAKGALILCALSMALALAMVFGLSHYYKTGVAAFAQSEKELQGARREIKILATDLASLEEHLASFKHLADIGLIGDPDRDIWVQNLEAIYKALDLPPTLRYVLAPPRQLGDGQKGLPASPIKAWRHDLDIELSGIHEGEFLAFLDALHSDWQTPFRLETCQMTRQPETGLQIKCTLRLFSLPVAGNSPALHGRGLGGG